MGVIVGFLLTYGAVLGPVVGVLIADYFLVRKRDLNLIDLYRAEGEYSYQGGFNLVALVCLLLGVVPVLAGLYVPDLKPLYDMGWFADLWSRLLPMRSFQAPHPSPTTCRHRINIH